MATNKKITELTELTGVDLADDDVIPIVDISAGTTHKIQKSTLAAAVSGVASITATTPIAVDTSTGAVTVSTGTIPVNKGGTGATTAAAAATALGVGTGDSPQFTAVNVGAASDTTLARASAGNLTVEGNELYRAGGTDVPVADGGTGASTLTDGGILLGSGTSAVTAMSALAKGAIVVGDGATDPQALAVGTNTYLLTADSSETLGVKWGQLATAGIADDAITSAKIADDAVVTASIADDAITSALIADDAVVSAAIADDAITSALIADDAVVTAAIADDAITAALMADDAVGVAQLSATGTASSSTFLRGDNSWAAAGGGKILQVVEATTTTEVSTTSSSYVDTGLTGTITPAATSSKILALCSLSLNSNGGSAVAECKIVRTISTTATDKYIYSGISHPENQSGNHFLSVLDSPSSTSACVYKVQAFLTDQSGTLKFQRNDGADIARSTITLIEVGA